LLRATSPGRLTGLTLAGRLRAGISARWGLLALALRGRLGPVVVAHAVLDAIPLRVDDAIEPLSDIVQDRAEVVAVEVAGAGFAQAFQQLLHSHHAPAAGELGTVLHHAAQSAPQAAIVEHLVGDLLHDVFRRE
jgi:hypothetical protein